MNRIVLVSIFISILIACDAKNSPFEQISYNEGESNQQYFIYYVKGYENIDQGAVPVELYDAINEHSLTLSESDGATTSKIFYYSQPNEAPDIEGFSAAKVERVAAQHRPILIVAIGPTGSRAY